MTFVKEISSASRGKLTTEQRKKASELIEKHRKEDAKLVKGIFKNLECVGGDVEFAHHEYKGEPTRVYHLIDGQEYEIPFGVAKHLNRQCKYKKSKHLVDKNGNKMVTSDTPIQRYQFISNDYM